MCLVDEIPVEASIRIATTPDGRLKRATVSLHSKCPIGPDWPYHLDAVSDVKEGMNGERTHCKALRVFLIVYSDDRWWSPLISITRRGVTMRLGKTYSSYSFTH